MANQIHDGRNEKRSGLPRGSVLHYFQIGSKMHIIEWLPIYFLPFVLINSPEPLKSFFIWNAVTQLFLFLLIVQIPCFLTEKMIYVDIGWPSGIVLMSMLTFFQGDGWWIRRWVIGGCLLLHGGRMALGALLLFGEKSNFTYRFQEDLPRYRYAKMRWQEGCGMPPSKWWIKMQHDTLQQAWANACVLSVPFALVAHNQEEEWYWLIGLSIWICGYVFENLADFQKLKWVAKVNKSRSRIPQDDGKCQVLGLSPSDGLWKLSRHPNYFGELTCWFGFVVTSLPSLFSYTSSYVEIAAWVRLGLLMNLVLLIRFFYDCLVYWTGAEPAEHFSLQKRGAAYREYQQKVRCFFPFEAPFFDHHRVAGWPGKRRAS